MNIKFKYAKADEETGTSVVVLKCGNKEYKGEATCHPDDDFSRFLGCQMAEVRAAREIKKDVKRELQAELKGVDRAYCMLLQTKECNYHSKEMQQMRKMKKILSREIALITDEIKAVEDRIKIMDEDYIKLMEKMHKKH